MTEICSRHSTAGTDGALLLEGLCLTDDRESAYRELARDRRFPDWPEAERARLVDAALGAGRGAAAAYRGQSPMDLADAFGLRICICEGSNIIAGRAVYAEIDSGTQTITLYRVSMEAMARSLAAHGVAGDSMAAVRDLCVAHELFHHLEAAHSPVLPHPWPPVVFTPSRLFPIRRSVPVCREIAAHAFAQKLTGVEFFPSHSMKAPSSDL